MPISGKNVVELVIRARDNTRGAFTKVGAQMRATTGHTGGLNKGMKAVTASMGQIPGAAGRVVGALGPLGIAGVAIAATAAIGLLGVSAVKSFTAFEDAMANVRKTTGMSKDEIAGLGDAIDAMALRIPVAHDKLAEIAAIAGQLGIQGKASILAFTEDVAKMSTAFDMAAGDVATAMAKLANIYDIPLEQISNMGSAINVLGNTTAASEAQLMSFAMSLGPTGRQLGFTYEQTIALGASMVEMGVDASDAGTRLNRAFSMIGQNLDELSKFMGVTTAEFTKSFEEMPMETFVQVIQKLSEVEGNLEANTIASKIFGEVGAKSIKAITGNLDGLHTNLENITTGYKENTSLTEEFAAKTDTLKAKFALVSNAAESFKIKIGAALAPLAGALAEGAVNAISNMSAGFNALQKVVGAIHGVFKAFFGAVQSAVSGALKPLTDMLSGSAERFSKLNVIIKVFSDILIIVTAGAKMFGTIVGNLLSQAITPFVAKIKEGIEILANFYNKLGPIKGLIEGVKGVAGKAAEGIGKWAESLKEAEPAVKELTKAVTDLEKEAKDVGPVLVESIKTLESSLTAASGSYKTAIAEISKDIDSLKDAWNLASDDQKGAIEDQIDALKDIRSELEDGEEAQKAYFETAVDGTEKAADAQKEFKVVIGDTTITFKDMAAEVVKNADAYKDLADNARALLDLDWTAFTDLEKALPNIDKGIGDMESSFVGLKDVLESNIDKLENVKSSVMGISEIAAPFLEKGFQDGVKNINNFAGSLSAAGTAINTFGDLTEVNVEGCINFSTSIYSMVSALGILKTQMHDMKPAFADMEAGIRGALEAFIYPTGKTGDIEARITEPIRIYKDILDKYGLTGDWALRLYKEHYGTGRMLDLGGRDLEEFVLEMIGVPGGDLTIFKKANEDYNNAMLDIQGSRRTIPVGFEYKISDVLKKSGDDIDKFASDVVHSSEAIEIAVNKQVRSLDYWSEQLTKITNALEPYLDFMRTLNELTALSTLSIDDINAGFDAISDSLSNLSTVLKDVDLAPIMEALFGEYKGEGVFGGGAATGVIKLMEIYAPKLKTLVTFTNSLSDAVTNLTGAFDALVDIEDSVLLDTDALASVLENVEDVISNLTDALSIKGGNFADILTTAFTNLLTAADPLIVWFRKNSVGVTEFNSALSSLMITINHVIDTMALLQDMTAKTVPEVDELAAGFRKAQEFVLAFDNALRTHLSIKTLPNIFESIEDFATDWKNATDGMEKTFKVFDSATSTINGLLSSVISLTNAFTDMKEVSIVSSTDMERAMRKIDTFIGRFAEALKNNMDNLSKSLIDLDIKWKKHAEDMKAVMPSYSTATNDISTLISTVTSLGKALLFLSETGSISEAKFGTGFAALISSIGNFTKAFIKNVDGLVIALKTLRTVWIANEETLVPLMIDFRTISRSFIAIATDAYNMSEAFRNFSKSSIGLKLGFERLIGFIKTVTEKTKEFYTPESARAVAQYVADIGLVIEAFGNLATQLETATSVVTEEVDRTVSAVSTRVSSLQLLTADMYNYGANAIISFAAGIYNFKWVLEGQLQDIANMIKAYLGVSSPTELGALKDIETWPRNLVKSFATGIKSEMGTLNNSFSGMTLAAPGGGGGNKAFITFQVTQNIKDKPTADYSTNALERMLSRHEIM